MKKIKKPSKKHLSAKEIWRLVGVSLALLIWVAAAIIASEFLLGSLLSLILGPEKFSQPVWTAVYSALSYSLALFLIIFVPWKIFKKWRTDRKELGLKGFPTWTDIGLAPVGFIVSLLIAALLVAIFSLFPWFNAEEAQDVGFNYLSSGGDRIIAFITLVIVAPIAEEIIFRGWLYGKLRARTNMIVSMLLVSLLFGIIHFQWNVGVNVFAMSIVLCGLREITGTIYSGIIMHMLKNGIAFFLIYVIGMT